MGWDRYDTAKAQESANQLYDELRIFQNLFQPSMKLQCKIRKGSRLIRRYDTPRTPFERVVESPEREIAKSWQHWLTRLRQPTPSSSPVASISNWSNSTSWQAMQTEHRGKGHGCNRQRG